MGFFDNVGKTISDAGKTTENKSKDAANIARLKVEISEEEHSLVNIYENIGRKYYELHCADPEGEMADIVRDAVEANRKIDDCKARITALQNKKVCHACGEPLMEDAVFCIFCGASVQAEEIKEEKPSDTENDVCTACGTKLTPGALFCYKCGSAVMPVKKAPESEAAQDIAEEVPESTEVPSQPEEHMPADDTEAWQDHDELAYEEFYLEPEPGWVSASVLDEDQEIDSELTAE